MKSSLACGQLPVSGKKKRSPFLSRFSPHQLANVAGADGSVLQAARGEHAKWRGNLLSISLLARLRDFFLRQKTPLRLLRRLSTNGDVYNRLK